MNDRISYAIIKTKNAVSKYSPEILTGIGIASMITSTILAVKATPKAVAIIQNEKKKKEKLTAIDMVKYTWKEYVPAVSCSIGGIVCIMSGRKISNKRSAALATAYAISEKTLRTYRDKVIETIGEKKEKSIRQNIQQDDIDKNPPIESKIVLTQKGTTMIKDTYSGRYFRSDLDTIRKASNELNRQMLHNNYISLNQWYNSIGLEVVKDGYHLGWNIDNGLLELDFGTCLVGDEPCITMDYSRAPKPNYDMMA